VAAAALLPLRFFFGATFVYAGLDKLLSPTFFDPASSRSIGAQLEAFARVSPLGGLIRVAEPLATPIGVAIAVVEIGVGLGALSGLAFRLAAAAGAALSLLFWLSVSWTTHPYYYGADLPYAAGWVALALAGHGGLVVPRWASASTSRNPLAPGGGVAARPADVASRRALLQAGLLAASAALVAAVTVPLRFLIVIGEAPGPSGGRDPNPSPSPDRTGGGPGIPVASVAALEERSAVSFRVPFDAPPPLPAGDPGVVVRLADGTFVAFDATCTHAACTVGWDAQSGLLLCPCHGATFDPADGGRVLVGPAELPLTPLSIGVDEATATIRLQ
jgi:thiosulfate dehydrogenase [quinone] large subunit